MNIHDWLYVTLVSIGILLVTIGMRGSFFFLPARVELPRRMEEALRYAPACALSAIIAPGIFNNPDKSVNIDFSNPRLWGLVAAAAVFVFKRNMLLMMTVGMAVFTLLRVTIG